jgi:secreted trypsin-like serine protease
MRRRTILLLATMAVGLLLSCAAALAADAQDYQAQVVGGTAVPNGKYPFMASLQEKKNDKPPAKEHFCGGTLIDRDSVLTAAHCAVYIKRTIPARRLRVVVGLTELNSDQGEARGIRSLADIAIHPRYNGSSSQAFDAAVIELASPVTFNPINLATANQNWLEKPGRGARVAGWGNTIKQPANCVIFCNTDSNYPNRMREASVPLVSDARAKDVYKSSYISGLMVAAGREGKDTCQGDSGGPMWAKTPQGRRQIGIASFGYGCGARGYPGVYTEVNAPSIRSFITDAASR